MIEVLFGESEAASMKVAKNKIVIGTTNGPTSVWIAGKKHHSKSLSVGDWWYARRIEYYIKQGKIRVIEDSENKYARMICRAD